MPMQKDCPLGQVMVVVIQNESDVYSRLVAVIGSNVFNTVGTSIPAIISERDGDHVKPL